MGVGPITPDSAGPAGSIATDTIYDAKGDIAVGTGDNASSRLAVGTNGYVLTADSAQSTGVKWAASGGGGPQLAIRGGGSATQYPFGHSGTSDYSGSTGVSSATCAIWMPFYVERSVTLDSISVSVHTASAGATARLGVYSISNPTASSLTGSLVTDFGTVSGASTGGKTATGTASLTAGWYAICVAFNSNSTVRWKYGGMYFKPYGFNPAYVQDQIGWRETGTDHTGGLPASIPAGAALDRSGNWPAGAWYTFS